MTTMPDKVWLDRNLEVWCDEGMTEFPYLRATPERLAAKEMLEALKKMVHTFDEKRVTDKFDMFALEHAHAAIAKATGETK